MVFISLRNKSLITKNFSLYVLFLFSGLLFYSAPSHAQSSIGIFVSNPSSDQKAQAWVEGIWIKSFGNGLRDIEHSLGGYPSQAKEAAQKALTAYKLGKKNYNELEAEKAQKNFIDAVKYYEQASGYAKDHQMLTKSLMYAGLTYLLQGKKQEGHKMFRQALLYNSKSNIKELTSETDKLKAFSQAQTKLSEGSKMIVKFQAKPLSTIFVNGKYQGITPLTLSLLKGKHIVIIRKPGYHRWTSVITVGSQPMNINAPMKPLAAMESWQQTGKSAAEKLSKGQIYPDEVDAYAKLIGAKQVLIAQTRIVNQKIWIQATAYDITQKKQLATGGAIVEMNSGGQKLIHQLGQNLLAGQSAQLGGWKLSVPAIRRITPPVYRRRANPDNQNPRKEEGGGSAGVIVGVSITVILLAGGGFAAYYFFIRPQCKAGACIKLKLN